MAGLSPIGVRPRRTALVALLAALAVALVALPAPPVAAQTPAPLTNLDHLNFLSVSVDPPEQAGHTTYNIAEEPEIGLLWVYAEPIRDAAGNPTGAYRQVGGGAYDPVTNTWGQGAYDTDDIARAAVVYLRHWRQTASEDSRERAYQMLRGLAYMQTVDGPDAGNTVLWMQPDGTLNPVVAGDLDDQASDSEDSYWLARTIWAYGEGYAAFRDDDPEFAAFLDERMALSLEAVDREILDENYGEYRVVDGLRWPEWMFQESSADATSEAILGLSAYVEAGGEHGARDALAKFAEGVASMQLGDNDSWPFGGIMPFAETRSLWHSWAAQMSGSLARAGVVLGDPALVDVAVNELASLTPHMLAQGGPDHEWQPSQSLEVQIAYSADAQLQGLLRAHEATGSPGFTDLAGIAGAWYFGNNPARIPMYDPATGVTFDGIEADRPPEVAQRVNVNSGAESTIHGLLSTLALDANPDVLAAARVATRGEHVTWRQYEAETGALSGGAETATPPTQWTGESLWSKNAYVALPPGGAVSIPVDLPVDDNYVLFPVLWRQQIGPLAVVTRHELDGRWAGLVGHGGAGEQGITEVPGYMDVADTRTLLPASAGATSTLAVNVGRRGTAQLDAVMVQPEVEWLVLSGDGHAQALLRSFSRTIERRAIRLPGEGDAVARVYDADGRLVRETALRDRSARVTIRPGGFTVVTDLR